MELTVQEILEDLHAAEDKCQEFEKKYGVRSEFFSMPIQMAGSMTMVILISLNGPVFIKLN